MKGLREPSFTSWKGTAQHLSFEPYGTPGKEYELPGSKQDKDCHPVIHCLILLGSGGGCGLLDFRCLEPWTWNCHIHLFVCLLICLFKTGLLCVTLAVLELAL